MQRRAPAADGIVVHGRQIVMHQRVAMDAFERAGGIERGFLLHAEQTRRLDEKKRPDALAAAKHRIAHGLRQNRWPQAGGRRAIGRAGPQRAWRRVRALSGRPSWGKRQKKRLIAAKTPVNITLIRRCSMRQPAGKTRDHGDSSSLRRARPETRQETREAPLVSARRASRAWRHGRAPPLHRRLPLRQSAGHPGDDRGEAEGPYASPRLGEAR